MISQNKQTNKQTNLIFVWNWKKMKFFILLGKKFSHRSGWALKWAPQGCGNSSKSDSPKSLWMLPGTWGDSWSCLVQNQKLQLMILVDPLQLWIFCGAVSWIDFRSCCYISCNAKSCELQISSMNSEAFMKSKSSSVCNY